MRKKILAYIIAVLTITTCMIQLIPRQNNIFKIASQGEGESGFLTNNNLNQKGILYFDWNALNEDAINFNASSYELNQKILKDVRRQKTSIVLMHDLHETKNTVKGLDSLIKTLKKEGYQILPITKNTKPIHHVSIDK